MGLTRPSLLIDVNSDITPFRSILEQLAEEDAHPPVPLLYPNTESSEFEIDINDIATIYLTLNTSRTSAGILVSSYYFYVYIK